MRTALTVISLLAMLVLLGCGGGGSESSEYREDSESGEHGEGSESGEGEEGPKSGEGPEGSESGEGGEGSEPGEHGEGSESGEGGEGSESGEHREGSESGEHGEESGTQYALEDTYDVVRAGARLILSYDSGSNTFTGTVENVTNDILRRVRVEVHLSNGIELGPTTPTDLAPGEVMNISLEASGQPFETWSAHPEVG